MTYGPVAEDLRHALARVMEERQPEQTLTTDWRETRVEFSVGGVPVDTEPENLVATVEVYRASILRAAAALSREGSATTRADLTGLLAPLYDGVPLPSVAQLASRHPVDVVDAWRHAAVAATTLTERELPALRGVSGAMRMALGRDGAQLAVAVLRLDASYTHVDGWRTITDRLGAPGARSLWVAAESARGWPTHDPATLAEGLVVDRLGYTDTRRRPQAPSPLTAVIDNVVAANDALHGAEPGSAMLRSIAKGHEVLTKTLAGQAWAAGMLLSAEDLTGRAGAYRLITAELANVRSGAHRADFDAGAIARGHILVAATTLPHVPQASAEDLTRLTAALHEADQIMSTTIQQGLRTGWFFESTDQIDWYTRGVIKAPRHRWQVMKPADHHDLTSRLGDLASLIRDEQYALSPDPASAHDRAWFAAQIERTSIPVPTNTPSLPASDPRAVVRGVLAAHHDHVPPPARIVRAGELGPAFAALVEARALRIVYGDAAVPAAVPITPAVRAAALADKVTGNTALAGRTAAWVHTGLPWRGKVQLAYLPGHHRPIPDADTDVWITRSGVGAITTVGEVRVTSPTQTAIEVAIRLPAPEAHRILVSLARNGLDLQAAADRMDHLLRLDGRTRARGVFAKAINAIQTPSQTPGEAAHIRHRTPHATAQARRHIER